MPGMLSDDASLQGDGSGMLTSDPTKSMYHDYLTNPDSTYAQDPSLKDHLQSVTAPGVQPGTLSGTPEQVAQQGLKPEAYSSTYGTTPSTQAYTNYNGQQVVTDDWFKKNIIESAKALGEDPMAYDKRVNPTTYGARWGVSADQMPAAPQGSGGTGTNPSTGIPVSTYTPTNATAATAGSQGYTAAQTQVTPGMLASGNLTQIMDPNSPIMVQARTRGDQLSASRGLLNSSIGISAAEDSAYRAAIPIAQQDASTQAQIGQSNTSATNQASQFTAGAANDAEKLNAQLLTGVSQSNAASSNASSQFNAGSSNTAALTGAQLASQQTIAQLSASTQRYVANLNSQTQASLADVNNKHSTLLQTSAQAATMMNNFASTVANIQASTTMGADAKQLAVDTQLTNLRNGLQALEEISGLDLAKYFPTTQAATPPATPPASTVEDRGYP